MNDKVEQFRQRRAERMAEKNKDGGPGSGKPKGYGGAKAEKTAKAEQRAMFDRLYGGKDDNELMEAYNDMQTFLSQAEKRAKNKNGDHLKWERQAKQAKAEIEYLEEKLGV